MTTAEETKRTEVIEACAEACSSLYLGFYSHEEVMEGLPSIIAEISSNPSAGYWKVGGYSVVKNPEKRYDSQVGEAPFGIYKKGLAENARTTHDVTNYECVAMMEVARYLYRKRKELFGE